jgi:transketolase
MQTDEVKRLRKQAHAIRVSVIKTLGNAGAGHTGGALSCVEILTVLYFRAMKINPLDPSWMERDRLVFSKGHGSCVLYCALAERGYFPQSKLDEFDRINGMLQGHPDMRKTPGVDMSTGALGQGLSCGIGMALGGIARRLDFRVYVVLGDGEIQEGQVWEAAMYAGSHCLNRLTAIIDYNKLQLSGKTCDTLNIEPLRPRWEAFGWHVQECDGHDISSLMSAIDMAKTVTGKPQVIIAHTVKGKGVSFIENQVDWHARAPDKEETQKALRELEECSG